VKFQGKYLIITTTKNTGTRLINNQHINKCAFNQSIVTSIVTMRFNSSVTYQSNLNWLSCPFFQKTEMEVKE